MDPSLFFPSSHSPNSDRFNGWEVPLPDSLDAMYIMGLHNDFKGALGFVGNLTLSMPSVCTSYFLSLPVLPFHFSPFPSFSLLPSSFPPLPSFDFLTSTHPPPSTANLLRPLLRTSHLLSRHTHTPPRSSAQKLTILEGHSCLYLILLWGFLCLLLILIREWACFILFVSSRDGRDIRLNSTHIVSSVLIADDYPLSFTHTCFFLCFSYPLSLILSLSNTLQCSDVSLFLSVMR
jgi:hypothetical protein